MSIYLIKNELIEILKNTNFEYYIPNENTAPVAEIVYKDNKRKFLDFDNYTEENLKEILKNKKRIVYVNLDFWNYNYCSKNNIDREVSEEFIQNLPIVVESVSMFSEGTITVLILLHEILLNVYKIKDNEVFIEYLEELKISKKIIKNFLNNMEYTLPLTKNYLELIKKVYTNDSIEEYVFNTNNNYTIDECRTILQEFTIDDIHSMTEVLRKLYPSNEKFLKYVCLIIQLFQNVIDMEKVIYHKKTPTLGFYLLTLNVENHIENYYYSVIKKYMDKNGSINIKVSNNKELQEKLNDRRKEIISYFSLD